MKKVKKAINLQSSHIFGGLIVVSAIIMDYLIKARLINGILSVSHEFVLSVFSLIFTVATLGSTLLSIIVGVSSNKILGLQLKEIVSLSESPLKIEQVIIETLIIVCISILALALEFCNLMAALACYLIWFLIYNSWVLCRIVFNKQYAKNIVCSSLSASSHMKAEYIHSWIAQLLNTISDNDVASEEEYIELLRSSICPREISEETSEGEKKDKKAKLSNDNHPNRSKRSEKKRKKKEAEEKERNELEKKAKKEFFDLIGKQIPIVFSKSCRHQSFVDSYRRILRLNTSSYSFFDERSITYNYFKTFKYADPKEVASINISGTIEDIIMCSFLSEEEKISNCYWLFDILLSNAAIDEEDQMEAIYSGFCSLLWLDDVYGYGETRVKTAIRLFRNKVLLAKNFEQGTRVYTFLLKALYTRNQYRPSKHLASILSQMVRMIYFWAYLEVETLSEKRRIMISKVPNSVVETNDNAVLSISFLIRQHHNRMVEFLIEDAFEESSIDPLDYWPDVINGKSIVCTSENKVKFALWFYSIWGYGFYSFPIEKYILFDTKEKLSRYKNICVAAREEFTNTGLGFTQQSTEHIARLQRLYNYTTQLPEKYISATYTSINEIIKKINNIQYVVDCNTAISSIYNQLTAKMKDYPDFVQDTSLSLKDAIVFQLSPLLCLRNDTTMSIAVHGISFFLVDAINNLIKKSLPKVQISFDQDGVVNLKKALSGGGFLYRNYTFYDDWGIDQTARESDDFDQLKKIVDSIDYFPTSIVHELVFLKENGICFNFSILEMRAEDLQEEQLEAYLLPYRVADEQYNIDGGVYHKTSAIEYFGKTRFLLHVKLTLAINIKESSGFQVVFREYS